MESKFEHLLNEDLIDVPDDFYEDGILYTEPEQLMERFEYLEESNLENIRKA